MDKIDNAISALAISMQYRVVEIGKRKFGIQMFWSGVELIFPCQKRVSQGVAVGAIHYLIVSNVKAILCDESDFEIIVGDKKIKLPVVYRRTSHDVSNEWTYQTNQWK